jgi:hypothetical protein
MSDDSILDRLDPEMVDNLLQADEAEIRKLLGPLVDADGIDELLQRIQQLRELRAVRSQ